MHLWIFYALFRHGHKKEIDLSIANIDGTHNISKRGQAVEY